MDFPKADKQFMRKAVTLAEKGLGRTSPNPPVGAVIVKKGRIIGKGFHKKAGEAHAEVEALRNCSESPKGAVLYVTLEPCNHQGRTGPCTEAILQAGIKEVFIGAKDPNPNVKGSGSEYLRQKGIIVHEGLLEDECRHVIRFFTTSITKKRPYIICKAAASLDGKTATSGGKSQWITSEAARRDVHRLRDKVDAILVGKHTFLKDNPKLTARVPGKKTKNPLRIVLNPDLAFPSDCNLRKIEPLSETVFFYNPDRVDESKVRETIALGFQALPMLKGKEIEGVLEFLHASNVSSLLIEGGAYTAWSFYQKGLIDEQVLYLAPKIIGGSEAPGILSGQGFQDLAALPGMESLELKRIGCDIRITGKIATEVVS